MERNPKGRVEKHMNGMGAPTRANVEERAREIAIIKGRDESNPTEADRVQATNELQNQDLNFSQDDNTDEQASAAGGTDFAANTGHKTQDRKPDDPQLLQEMEVREGVREAEHDTMLAERSEPDKNE